MRAGRDRRTGRSAGVEREREGLSRDVCIRRGRREAEVRLLIDRLVADRREYRKVELGDVDRTVSESFSSGVPLSVTMIVTLKLPNVSGVQLKTPDAAPIVAPAGAPGPSVNVSV
jgi:hypothetical protein